MSEYDVSSAMSRVERVLEGRVGLVTGGASGIGAAAVRTLVEAGARVMIADIDEPGARETIDGIGDKDAVSFAKTDISQLSAAEEMVAATVEAFGKLDFALNNAGVELLGGPMLHEVSEAEWQRLITVNLTGAWNCVRAEIPALRDSGGGSIVLTSSGLGLGAMPGHSAYIASKSGVVGLTKAAAVEYGAEGIRVNCICPGAINTPMFRELQKADPAIASVAREKNPMKRFGEPAEIADAALWLVSDGSTYVNGHALVIDGGHAVSR
jgi:NAD(P)-dependent dehydrogenase (short-subunit alcohol dehydrogenase family)